MRIFVVAKSKGQLVFLSYRNKGGFCWQSDPEVAVDLNVCPEIFNLVKSFVNDIDGVCPWMVVEEQEDKTVYPYKWNA